MNDYTIYALKVTSDYIKQISESLNQGVGRFGWSYVESSDLNTLKDRVDKYGWNSLSDHEKDCCQFFLLEIVKGDYVVYITPGLTKYIIAKVNGEYYWEWDKNLCDFAHRFHVDKNSIMEFDKYDAAVHPYLRARLVLQGRWWRIYAKPEFENLLNSLEHGTTGISATKATSIALLEHEIASDLLSVTQKIHRTHPNFDLEGLIAEKFKRIPNVKKAEVKHGLGDHGADILVTFEDGLPFSGLITNRTCLVQVKSYDGEHWDTKAVRDLRNAFEHYPNADMGLIISTAQKSSPVLEEEIKKLESEQKKPVGLLIGTDVASFYLNYR